MVIKRVNAFSVGRVMGFLYAMLGLIGGMVLTLFTLARDPSDALLGVAAIVVVPVVYGLIGLIGGVILGALYNFVASIVGGIEIELGHEGHAGPGFGATQPR